MNIVEWMRVNMRMTKDYQPRVIAALAGPTIDLTAEELEKETGIPKATLKKYPLPILIAQGIVRVERVGEGKEAVAAYALNLRAGDTAVEVKKEALKKIKEWKAR